MTENDKNRIQEKRVLWFANSKFIMGALIVISKWLLAVIVSLYAIEFFLFYEKSKAYQKNDNSQFATVQLLRQDGSNVQRDIGGNKFVIKNGLKAEKGLLFPLGGISNTKTVMEFRNRALDFYSIIETDEHGFNNKKGLYNSGNVDITLLGDCTLEYVGEKNSSEENIGALLNNLHYKTINLSKQGSAYTQYLPILKEYVEPLRPKVVIFLYSSMNLSKVDPFGPLWTSDKANPGHYVKMPEQSFLRKYLNDENFTQNLMTRQTEIDLLLTDYLHRNWEKNEKEILAKKEAKKKEAQMRWWSQPHIFKLYQVRGKLDIGFSKLLAVYSQPSPPPLADNPQPIIPIPPTLMPYPYPAAPSPDFIKLIKKMKELVSSWNGELYGMSGIHLQGFERYRLNDDSIYAKQDEFHRNIEKTFAKLGIRTINLRKEVFDVHPDPLSLFPGRIDSHENVEAKRLIAKVIAKRLKADGIFPRKN
jgi:hypothetical protein